MSVAMSNDPSRMDDRGRYAGRLRAEGASNGDRTYAVMMHLAPLSWFLIGPFCFAVHLIMWLVRKDDSDFIDDHGREIVNFWISQLIISLICIVTVIGLLFIPVQLVIMLVGMIRGSVAANNGEYFRYPMTFRFIN